MLQYVNTKVDALSSQSVRCLRVLHRILAGVVCCILLANTIILFGFQSFSYYVFGSKEKQVSALQGVGIIVSLPMYWNALDHGSPN